MWNKLTGKDSDVASPSSKRKSTSDRSDRDRRERRAESIVTSGSSRAPPSSSRGDREERRISRSSTFPLEEQHSGASSYATAPTERHADSDTTSRRSHRRDKEKREEKTQYRVTDRGVERIKESSPSPERRKSSSKRDSSREREKTKEERREQRRRERARTDDDHHSSSSNRQTRSRSDKEGTRGPEDFPSQISGPGFSQFPGQDGALGFVGPSQSSHSTSDAHVANQFPGQHPDYSWHMAKAVSEGGVGLAAEYYGDQGESVTAQPGFRTHSPNMLVNPDAHLVAASASANPAQDTGHGSAADFYDGKVSPVPFTSSASNSTSMPSKPGKKPSGSSSSLAGVATLAGTAAAGYALSQSNGHKPSRIEGSSSSLYQQGTNMSIASHHSESAPTLPTMASLTEAGPSNSRPGKHSSSHSNAAAYAAGAAALGAAGAYALHEHHEHEHQKPSGYGSRPANSHGRPNRPMYNMSDGSFVMNQYGGAANGMMMEHKHRGPVSRLVDWWKDHEDVRKMEAYTQEIGVCRYCFDPQSSIYDAPRKHHYSRRKRSKESLVSGRVEKQSRYGYASDEDKGWGVGKWIGAGLAGYGAVKVGKKLLGNDRDFDDTYSVKTGRRLSDVDGSRISLVSRGSRRGSDSESRRRSYSRQSEGVVRHKSGRRSDASISIDVHGDGSKEYASVRRKKSHRSRSRSSSGSRRGSKAGLLGAGLGLAAGAAAAHQHDKHRRHSRSRSPAVKVRHKQRSRSRSSERSHRRRSSHSKKKAGFFTWGNESSSSTDSALVYGFNVPRKKSSVKSLRSAQGASVRHGQKKIKPKNSDEKLTATLAGLAATGAAISAVQAANRGRRHNADLVAVKERKGKKRVNESLLGFPGKRSGRTQRRSRSGASNGSSSSSSLSIASWRDEPAVDDDGWEDESVVGDEDLPSSASSDDGLSGLAYGDDSWSSRKARKSTDSLVSDASGTDKWFWRWGGKKKSKRRSSDIEAKHSSGLGTAATMAGALAAGATVASMSSDRRKDDRKSVQFEQRPPPTPLTGKYDAPSEVSSVSGSLHTVYPTATSDPYNFDAVSKHGRTPSRANTFPLQQSETTVYASRPEIKHPQPVSKVRDSVYTTQPDYQPSYTAPIGPPVFSNYDVKQPLHTPRRESGPVSPGGSNVLKDVAIGAAAAAATGGVIAALSKADSDKDARRRREAEDAEDAERVRRKGKKEATEIQSRQRREQEDLERLKRETDKREDERRRASDITNDRELRRRQYDREMAARAEIAIRDQQAKDASEAEMQAHYESERAARRAQRAERELAEAERVAREAVLADQERVRRASEAERATAAREVRHDEQAENHSAWTAPLVAGAGAALVGSGVADMASNRSDRDKAAEEDDRDLPAVTHVISPDQVVDLTPNKVAIDMDDDKNVEDALNDPDFFTKMVAKKREVADHVSPSNAVVYTPIARPRSRSEVIKDFDDRYKDVKESVNNEEFWAPEELKHRSGQGAQVEESEWKRDGPNADVVFDNYPGAVHPPYEPSYAFNVRDGSGGTKSLPNPLAWVPRLKLIPPTPPPSSPAQGSKRDETLDSVGGAEREHREQQEEPKDAARSIQGKVEEIRPSQERRFSAQSHSIGEVHIDEPEEPPTPPSAARKPSSSRVSFGTSEIHSYEVPSPEPSILEGHEGHFPKLDLNEQASQGASRDLPSSSTDQSPLHTKAKAGQDVETPVEEELVTEGAAQLAERSRDSPYFPHNPANYDAKESPKESETPIYEATSPERTPVYEDPDERESFYQQPFYDTVSDIGVGGEVPRRPGFIVGEVDTPGDEKKDPIREKKAIPAEETESKYMPSMPGAFDDEAAPSTLKETQASRDLADQPESTIAEDEDEVAGLNKRERRKAEKAKAKRLAEATAAGVAGVAAAAALSRDDGETPTNADDDREAGEDEWFEEPKRSKKKSKTKTKSKTNGGPVNDEPASYADEDDPELPRGRYDYEGLERKKQTRHEEAQPDYDDVETKSERRKSRDRVAEDIPTRSAKSEGYDERQKSKRRSHRPEADEFIDEEYSRQVSASEPVGYHDRDGENGDRPKRKKSSRRSGDDFDDAESVGSSKSKYDDDDDKKERKKDKRGSLASLASILIGGSSSTPSSKKDRDVDATSEISSRSRSSKNDDEDEDRRSRRKKEKRKSRSEVDEDDSFLGSRAEENEMAPLPPTTVAAAGPAPVSMPSIDSEPVSHARQEREVVLSNVGSKEWKEAMESLAHQAPHDEASEAAGIELPKSPPPSPTPEDKAFEAGLLADLQRSLERQRADSSASVATAITKPTPPRPAPINTSRTFSPTSVPVRFRRPPLAGHARSSSVEPEDYRPASGDFTGATASSPLADNSSRSTPRHAKSISAESPVSASFRTNTQEMRPLYLVERNRYRNSWSGPDSSSLGKELETLPSLPSSRASSVLGSEEDVKREISTPGWEDAIAGAGEDDFFSAHGTPEWRRRDSFSAHGTPERSGGDFFSAHATPEKEDMEDDWLNSQEATPRATHFDANVFNKYIGAPAADEKTEQVLGSTPIETVRSEDVQKSATSFGDLETERAEDQSSVTHTAVAAALIGDTTGYSATKELSEGSPAKDDDEAISRRSLADSDQLDLETEGSHSTGDEIKNSLASSVDSAVKSPTTDPLLRRGSTKKEKKQAKGKKKKGKTSTFDLEQSLEPELSSTEAVQELETVATDATSYAPEAISRDIDRDEDMRRLGSTDQGVLHDARDQNESAHETIVEAKPSPLLTRTMSKGKKKGKKGKSYAPFDIPSASDTAVESATEGSSTPAEIAEDAFVTPSTKAQKKKTKKAKKQAEFWLDEEEREPEADDPVTRAEPPEVIIAEPMESSIEDGDRRPDAMDQPSQTDPDGGADVSRSRPDVATPTVEKDDPFSSTSIPSHVELASSQRPALAHASTTPAPFTEPLMEEEEEELYDTQYQPQSVVHNWGDPLEDSIIEDGQQKGFILERPETLDEPLEEPFVEDGQQKGFILPESVPLPEDEMDLEELEREISHLDEQLHPTGARHDESPVSVKIPEERSVSNFETQSEFFPGAVVPHSLTPFGHTRSRSPEPESTSEMVVPSSEPQMLDTENEPRGDAADKDALRDMLRSMPSEQTTEQDALNQLNQRMSARLLSDQERPTLERSESEEAREMPAESAEQAQEAREEDFWQPKTKKKKGKKGKRDSVPAIATVTAAAAAATLVTNDEKVEDLADEARVAIDTPEENKSIAEPLVDDSHQASSVEEPKADDEWEPTTSKKKKKDKRAKRAKQSGSTSRSQSLAREGPPEDINLPTVLHASDEDLSRAQVAEPSYMSTEPQQGDTPGISVSKETTDTALDEPTSQLPTDATGQQSAEADEGDFQLPTKKSKKAKREEKKKSKDTATEDTVLEPLADDIEYVAFGESVSQPTLKPITADATMFEDEPSRPTELAAPTDTIEEEWSVPVKKSKKEKRKDKKKAQAFDWDEPAEEQTPADPLGELQGPGVEPLSERSQEVELPHTVAATGTADASDELSQAASVDLSRNQGSAQPPLSERSVASAVDEAKGEALFSSIDAAAMADAEPVEQLATPADDDPFEFTVKKSKKDKRKEKKNKGKGAATPLSESITPVPIPSSFEEPEDLSSTRTTDNDDGSTPTPVGESLASVPQKEAEADPASPYHDQTRDFIYGDMSQTGQPQTTEGEHQHDAASPDDTRTFIYGPASYDQQQEPPQRDQPIELTDPFIQPAAGHRTTSEKVSPRSSSELNSAQTTTIDKMDLPASEDDTVNPAPESTKEIEPSADVDFTATLAAGLEDSGMDPNIVLRDSTYFTKPASPHVEAADIEDEYSPPPRNRRKGRASRTPSVQSLQDTCVEDALQDAKATDSERTFDDTLAAGLTSAGFDADKVLQDAESSGWQSPQEFAEPEAAFTVSRKKKKGKKGRASGPDPIYSDAREIQPEVETVETATMEQHAEQLEEPSEAVDESSWTTSGKSKGKKGKKGKKGSVTAASSRAPLGALAAAAAPLVVRGDDEPSESSSKGSKKSKKGKKASILSAEEQTAGTDTPVSVPFDESVAPDVSVRQIEEPLSLDPNVAAIRIQHAWRSRSQRLATSADRIAPAEQLPTPAVDNLPPELQPEEAARRIQTAWRARSRKHAADRSVEDVEVDQRAAGVSTAGLTEDEAARRIQGAWRKRPRQLLRSTKRPTPQHRESTFTEFEEDLEDDVHNGAGTAAAAGGLVAAGALAAHHILDGDKDRETASPEPLDRPRSSQDIAAAYEPTWSFGDNRDSAIQISPTIPESARQHNVRDSGFHEAPVTPSAKQGLERRETTGVSTGSPMLTGTTTSSADPLRVSVEVGSDWDLAVSNPSVQASAAEQSRSVEDSRNLSDIDEIASPRSDADRLSGVTSPLQSATKPRASELFNSSPSTREVATPEGTQRSAPRRHRDATTGSPERAETHDNDFTAPRSFKHSPSGALDTIDEHIPEASPLSKKSRRDSDVGMPDHAIKTLRRTGAPDSMPKAHRDHDSKSPLPRLATGSHSGAAHEQPASMDELIARKSWPPLDEDNESVDLNHGLRRSSGQRSLHGQDNSGLGMDPKHRQDRVMSPAERVRSPGVRSPSVLSDQSNGSLSRFRTPEHGHQRTLSNSSQGSTHSLRRVDRSASGDLRGRSRVEAASGAKSPLGPTSDLRDDEQLPATLLGFEPQPGARAFDKGKGRARDMGDTLEAMGEARGSPMSPARPPSLRKRQSMHIMDLESKVEQFTSENRQLQDRLAQAQHEAQVASQQLEFHAANVRTATENVQARDVQLSEKDAEIAQARATLQSLQEQLTRLQQENEELQGSHRGLSEDAEGKYAALQSEHAQTYQSWQESTRELDELREKHHELSGGMEELVHQEIALALADRNEEIKRLNEELESATGQIKMLQHQILESKQGESFLSVRDEDYFDSACQQLCQHVQQWVLKFSKFSDGRPCRLSSELDKVRDLKPSEREKLEDRLDGAVLDGADVDLLLADRVQRRDVFMSLMMSMLWEHVFTRYLFGMDRDQRQKLKTLEKTLTEVGPRRAVAQWRAITLTLLAKRPSFQSQRTEDTEAVMWAIYTTLASLLPPPKALEVQVQDQLRKVIRLAVDLSIEMRTQRAEYIMLQPLQPEYDTNGDLVQKVPFNAALMNERSGDKEVGNNEEWEQRGAMVKIMLFPLVVKRGDDLGEGEDEVVICPAQVLVAKPKKGKNVRVLSGAVEMDPRRSMQSVMPPESVEMSGI